MADKPCRRSDPCAPRYRPATHAPGSRSSARQLSGTRPRGRPPCALCPRPLTRPFGSHSLQGRQPMRVPVVASSTFTPRSGSDPGLTHAPRPPASRPGGHPAPALAPRAAHHAPAITCLPVPTRPGHLRPSKLVPPHGGNPAQIPAAPSVEMRSRPTIRSALSGRHALLQKAPVAPPTAPEPSYVPPASGRLRTGPLHPAAIRHRTAGRPFAGPTQCKAFMKGGRGPTT